LVTAAGAALAALVTIPSVASVIFPLHDAMRALQTGRKLHFRRPLALAPSVDLELGATAISELERDEAIMSGAFLWVIGGANAPLHPAFVVGGQDGFDIDGLSSFVSLDYDSFAVFSSGFMESRRRFVPSVATNAALHSKTLLVHEAAAKALVVVVVGRHARNAPSPSGRSSIRFGQISVSFSAGTP